MLTTLVSFNTDAAKYFPVSTSIWQEYFWELIEKNHVETYIYFRLIKKNIKANAENAQNLISQGQLIMPTSFLKKNSKNSSETLNVPDVFIAADSSPSSNHRF